MPKVTMVMAMVGNVFYDDNGSNGNSDSLYNCSASMIDTKSILCVLKAILRPGLKTILNFSLEDDFVSA